MRSPLRVEAKVAEELRNWLTSELERLDASNTNPFAHHVVTILLQEDLDIEDEPLSTGSCFDPWSVKTVRQRGKKKDQQIKAAVQFLQSAISNEESIIESKIELIINELMIRIEATKERLSQGKSRGRDLLGALTINTDNQVQQPSVSVENRSYNEVFPSLPGETQLPKVLSATLISPNNSVWNKSPGKENSHHCKVRRLSQIPARRIQFTDKDEAAACNIAARVFALTMPEGSLPNPEAMDAPPSRWLPSHQIDHAHLYDPFGSCWRSAFYPIAPSHKLFSPLEGPLPPVTLFTANDTSPRRSSILVVKHDGSVDPSLPDIFHDLSQLVDLLQPEHHKVFFPVKDSFQPPRPSPELYKSDLLDLDDIEVANILRHAKKPSRQKKKVEHRPRPSSQDVEAVDNHEDIQGALVFPDHSSQYFDEMVKEGAICMYPDIGATLYSSHHQNQDFDQDQEANSLGAVGGRLPIYDDPNEEQVNPGRAWAGVTFTNDILSFALQEMESQGLQNVLSVRCAPDKYRDVNNEVNAEDCPVCNNVDNEGDAEQQIEMITPPIGLGGFWQSRDVFTSSDSGVHVHHPGSRTASASPDRPLSAPAAMLLPPAAWPLEQPANHNDGLMGQDLPGIPPSTTPPPGAEADTDRCFGMFSPELASYFGWRDTITSVAWSSASGVEGGIDANGRALTVAHNDPGEAGSYSLFSGNDWDVPLLNKGRRIPLFDVPGDGCSHEELVAPCAGGSHSPSPDIPPEAPLPGRLQCPSPSIINFGYRSPPPAQPIALSASNHFMPSKLTPGMGMDENVACFLQCAYVNNIFNNSSEASNLHVPYSTDLEFCWQIEEDVRSICRLSHGIVTGRTCSLWLENRCFLGIYCPFDHPSL